MVLISNVATAVKQKQSASQVRVVFLGQENRSGHKPADIVLGMFTFNPNEVFTAAGKFRAHVIKAFDTCPAQAHKFEIDAGHPDNVIEDGAFEQH